MWIRKKEDEARAMHDEALARIDDRQERQRSSTRDRACGILDLTGELDLRERVLESGARLVEAAEPDQDLRAEERSIGPDRTGVARDLGREGEASGEGVFPRVHLTRRPRRGVARATA